MRGWLPGDEDCFHSEGETILSITERLFGIEDVAAEPVGGFELFGVLSARVWSRWDLRFLSENVDVGRVSEHVFRALRIDGFTGFGEAVGERAKVGAPFVRVNTRRDDLGEFAKEEDQTKDVTED